MTFSLLFTLYKQTKKKAVLKSLVRIYSTSNFKSNLDRILKRSVFCIKTKDGFLIKITHTVFELLKITVFPFNLFVCFRFILLLFLLLLHSVDLIFLYLFFLVMKTFRNRNYCLTYWFAHINKYTHWKRRNSKNALIEVLSSIFPIDFCFSHCLCNTS